VKAKRIFSLHWGSALKTWGKRGKDFPPFMVSTICTESKVKILPTFWVSAKCRNIGKAKIFPPCRVSTWLNIGKAMQAKTLPLFMFSTKIRLAVNAQVCKWKSVDTLSFEAFLVRKNVICIFFFVLNEFCSNPASE